MGILGSCSLFFVSVIVLVVVLSQRRRPPKAQPVIPQLGLSNGCCPACTQPVVAAKTICPGCQLDLRGELAAKLLRLRIAKEEVEQLAERAILAKEIATLVSEKLTLQLWTVPEPPVPKRELLPAVPATPPPVPPVRKAAASTPEVAPPTPARRSAAPEVETASALPEFPQTSHFSSTTSPQPARQALPMESARPSRPALPEVLSTFMHERNILWGELVGGVLIVGCSIALVISLWGTLRELPYSIFLLTSGITAGVFGAGYYSFHHWRLTGTSQGLLAIALLLTPLNLLLLADSGVEDSTRTVDVMVKVLATILFAGLVRTGARDLAEADALPTRRARWLFALALVGAPMVQTLPWLNGSTWGNLLATWLPLGCFVLATSVPIGGSDRMVKRGDASRLTGSWAVALLLLVGLGFFALGTSWGFVVSRLEDSIEGWHHLALPLTVAGVPILTAGLLVQRGLHEPVRLKATGTGVAVAGIVVFGLAVMLSWPDPQTLLCSTALIMLSLGILAFREPLPWLYLGAVPAAGLVALIGYQGIFETWETPRGQDPGFWMVGELTSAASGAVLVGLGGLVVCGAEAAIRIHRRPDATVLACGALGLVAVGLGMSNFHGREQPSLAAAAHLAAGLGLVAAQFRWRAQFVAQLGVWLLLPTVLWSLWSLLPEQREVWGLVVAIEGMVLALGGAFLPGQTRLRRACRDVAGAATLLAGGLTLTTPGFLDEYIHTVTLFGMTAATLILAGSYQQRLLTWVGSLLGLAGLALLSATVLEVQSGPKVLLLAFLSHATLAIAGTTVLWRGDAVYFPPLRSSALLSICFALLLLLFPPSGQVLAWAGLAGWLGLLWLGVALLWQEKGAFVAVQGVLTWSAILAGVAWVEQQTWFSGLPMGLVDPRALQGIGLAVALLSLVWGVVRLLLYSSQVAQRLWNAFQPSVDQWVLGGLVVGQLLLAAWGLLPALVAELIPAEFAPEDLTHLAKISVWGMDSWLLLALATLAMLLMALRPERYGADVPLLGLSVVGLTIPFLLASQFAGPEQLAAASALRWGLALVFLMGSLVLGLRQTWGHLGLGLPVSPSLPVWVRGLLTLGALVVLGLTAVVAILGFSGQSPSGPLPTSVFGQMGATVSVLSPLAMLVVGLAGMAWRERSPEYAFAGGWVWIATLAGGYALGVVASEQPFDFEVQLRVGLIAIGAAAIWSLTWLAAGQQVPGRVLRTVFIGTGLGGLIVIDGLAFRALLLHPERPLTPAFALLGTEGALVLLAMLIATHWNTPVVQRRWVLGLAVVLAGLLVAGALQPWDAPGKWLSFHGLMATWGLGGALLAERVLQRTNEVRWTGVAWVQLLALGLTLMAVRGAGEDPYPWVPSVSVALSALLTGVVAFQTRQQWREYLCGTLALLAGVLAGVAWGAADAPSLALAAAAGLAVSGGSAATLRICGLDAPVRRLPPFAHLAMLLSLGLLLFGILPTLNATGTSSSTLIWATFATIGLGLGMLTLDSTAHWVGRSLYLFGLAGVGLGLAAFRSGPIWPDTLLPAVLAGYVLAASGVATIFQWRLGLNQAVAESISTIRKLPSWLISFQALVGVVVLGLATRIAWVEPLLWERLLAPLAGLLLVGATILLRPRVMQGAGEWSPTLKLLPVTFVLLAWALPDPAQAHPWLPRQAGAFLALAASTVVYLAGPRHPDFGRVGRWVGVLALGFLGVVLVQQISVYDPLTRTTPLGPLAVGSVFAGLLGLLVLALWLALHPERDPLGAVPQGRTGYVYLAEFLLVLGFAHLRLNVPQAFTGAAVRYWTFIVMGLAFVGVGLAELFARRGFTVLARPLLRTGVLLPLIPLLAFWARPPVELLGLVDDHAPGLQPLMGYLAKLPQHYDIYALLWFLAGSLYGLIALSRHSFGWALLGALAANAGVWALLAHQQIPASVHPQAWVIPLALIVLISEHVNRARLHPSTASGLRYLGIGMIYVASATDLFIAGVGDSLWLPVILAALCVAGVLAGILLRVRAFVYLGVSFLLLDVFAMIWHAAVDRQQTWVWYVSGIVLGIAILALFAWLERRQQRVREMVEQFREWN